MLLELHSSSGAVSGRPLLMSKNLDPVHAARARVATAARLGQDPTPARRDLATAWVERSIVKAITGPNAITAEQRRTLAEMLVGGAK